MLIKENIFLYLFIIFYYIPNIFCEDIIYFVFNAFVISNISKFENIVEKHNEKIIALVFSYNIIITIQVYF